MSGFEDFLNIQTIRNIFIMFLNGVFTNAEVLKSVVNVIREKIVSEGVILNQIELSIYDNICRTFEEGKKQKETERRLAVCYNNQQPSKSTASTEQANTSSLDNENEISVEEIDRFVIDTYERLFQDQNGETSNITEAVQKEGSIHKNNFKYMTVQEERECFCRKFGVHERRLRLKLNDASSKANPLIWLKDALNEVFQYATRTYKQSDFVGIVLEVEEFVDKPVCVSFRRLQEYNIEIVMKMIENVLQSNRTFFSNNVLRVQVDSISPPRGNGFSLVDRKGVSFYEFCLSKNSIYVIKNNGNRCLAMALVIAREFCVGQYQRKSLEIFKNETGQMYLELLADELCNEAGVDLSNGGGYEEINAFQNYFNDRYTIVVYNNRNGTSVYYEGPRTSGRPCFNLIFESNHFNVILSLTGAFSAKYFCELCRKRYSHLTSHKNCSYTCPCCHSKPPCNLMENELNCKTCNRNFRGRVCFENHKINKICSKVKVCATCKVIIMSHKKHKCGFSYCTICGEDKPIRHDCYMKVNVDSANRKKKEDSARFLFLFYDFETTQDTVVTDTVTMHLPNLCVAQQVCFSCVNVNDTDLNNDCEICGVREHVFFDKPVEHLLELIATLSKTFQVTAIAHNMKSFDGCFILQHVFNDVSRWNPSVVKTGMKLMSITCGTSVRFIDSLNFIQLPLAEFPKTFNITSSKGYFPHYFNTLQNQNYSGMFPDIHFYGVDSMKEKARSDFLLWYNEQGDKEFNMRSELLKYCKLDVEILRLSCIKFRKSFIETNKVDPFLECITIASACNLVFRRNFLKENTIGILPQGGYRLKDKQSSIAIKWLLWEGFQNNIKIVHSGNSREVRLKEGHLVDGFCYETNSVYEFHGCWYHGCEKCFFNQTAKLSKKYEYLYSRRENTKLKEKAIIDAGYNIKTIWECEFNKEIKNNVELQNFLDNRGTDQQTPLNPRDGFFGGRTNACKLYYKCEDDEKIMYFDVCSLYPYINKYGKYPIGHPIKIHIGNDECGKLDLFKIEGLIKCTVLPPYDLYHPVLPYKCNNKLVFPLCRKCVELSCQFECEHDDFERQFTGTFVVDEVRKALQLNYRVVEIMEFWEYKTTAYNNLTKEGGLFSDYVNNFLKLKQEASGWPSWCTTDQLKDRYITSYFEREGIQLNRDNICKNPGSRFLSKIMLNCFWGKFGQRENLHKTEIINEPQKLFQLLTNPSAVVHNVTVINPDVVLVTWEKVDGDICPLKTANVVIAAYTTAQARLELYKYLEILGKRVLYYDTDSVLFVQKNNETLLPTGDFLGDLTDEIIEHGEGSYISEFVSGGPKNYGYKFWSNKSKKFETVCKVKGITLHYANSQLLDFETIKRMVCDKSVNHEVTLEDRTIVRNYRYQVFSKDTTKKYRMHYTKRRRLLDCYDTLPYGFNDRK